MELLCTCFLQFFSSSDIPELWLLMCLGKHFSSEWSWFFCLYCPADAIFLFIFLGMVSYVQLKNNSSPLPPFLLYFRKTDISSKTTFPFAGITEQPLQMCLLFFLQALIPLLMSWIHQRAPGLQLRRLPPSGPRPPTLSLRWLAEALDFHRTVCSHWQNGTICLLMFLTLKSFIVWVRTAILQGQPSCHETENSLALKAGEAVECLCSAPHQKTYLSKTLSAWVITLVKHSFQRSFPTPEDFLASGRKSTQ